MKYLKFRDSIFVLAIVIVAGTSILEFVATTNWLETILQLLYLPIIFGALYYGKKGGFFSGAACSIISVIVYSTQLRTMGLIPAAESIIIRVVMYCGLGFIMGALSTNLQYFFTRLRSKELIDEETGLFSREYFARLLSDQIYDTNRYGTICSLLVLKIPTNVYKKAKLASCGKALKEIGDLLSRDTRATDKIGRFSEAGFLILLPHTLPDKAILVKERFLEKALKFFDEYKFDIEKDKVFKSQIFSFTEDKENIEELIRELKLISIPE